MIVKNEADILDDCLRRAAHYADEIVLVDTGSSDSTLQIARNYNVKVYEFKWIDDFAAARNFSLGKASVDWILVLDADELIKEKSRRSEFIF